MLTDPISTGLSSEVKIKVCGGDSEGDAIHSDRDPVADYASLFRDSEYITIAEGAHTIINSDRGTRYAY